MGSLSILTSLLLVACVVLALIFVPFDASSEGDAAQHSTIDTITDEDANDSSKSAQTKSKRNKHRPRVHNIEDPTRPVLL